jgi:hypothetical protein
MRRSTTARAGALLWLACLPAHAASEHDMAHDMGMSGMYGPYSMMREASGTSWQPDSTPHAGLMGEAWGWRTMAHGFATAIRDHQGGPRGDDKDFSTSMLMGAAQRPAGGGTLGLRGMLSLDPLMGDAGYPLLFQTGESADGVTPLVDRQHPHNLFIELAATYSVTLDARSSVFVYAGLPGEPALGPPAFMHRLSGMDNPEAPITHHWMDSTHITNGVVTLGYVRDRMKLEASVFRGREPGPDRYRIETGRLDSYSLRLSCNPTDDWSLQVSYGRLESPEALHPDEDVRRTTASASYNVRIAGALVQTTLAWGRNDAGKKLDGYLLESSASIAGRHTFFGRVERVDKDELFPYAAFAKHSGPRAGFHGEQALARIYPRLRPRRRSAAGHRRARERVLDARAGRRSLRGAPPRLHAVRAHPLRLTART